MSYVQNSLVPGESVLQFAHMHWVIYLAPALITFVSLIFAVAVPPAFLATLLGIVLLFVAWIKVRTTELAVTNRKIVAKSGLIARNTIEQRLEKVESINVHQTILGRILNYGSITIHGTGITSTPINMISDPLQFRRVVDLATSNKGETV